MINGIYVFQPHLHEPLLRDTEGSMFINQTVRQQDDDPLYYFDCVQNDNDNDPYLNCWTLDNKAEFSNDWLTPDTYEPSPQENTTMTHVDWINCII